VQIATREIRPEVVQPQRDLTGGVRPVHNGQYPGLVRLLDNFLHRKDEPCRAGDVTEEDHPSARGDPFP
jgi:hypothetical protein